MKQNVHLKESCVEKLMAFTYYKFDRGLNIKKTIIWDEFYEIHTGKLGSISVILFYQCHLLMINDNYNHSFTRSVYFKYTHTNCNNALRNDAVPMALYHKIF